MVSLKGKKGSPRKISPKKKKEAVPSENEVVGESAVPSANGKDSFESIFGQVEEYAILLLDEKGNITSWNKGAERIKGYKASEILGKNYRIFYAKEDRSVKLSERLLEEARTKGKTDYEGWRIRKDGSRFWGSMTLTALKNEQGHVTRFLKVTRDQTDKKIAEDKLSNFVEELKYKNEELKKSEERYHKMISEVRDYAIILLDRDGKVVDWNVGAEKLKGYTREEILGKSFKLFYPKEEKEKHVPERLLNEAITNGSTFHEGWRLKKNGQRFWGAVAITALHDNEGNIIGFSKVTRDLTDRRTNEDRISNVIEELRQMNEQLKQSEERYHKMVEEVQDYAIVLLDVNGDILNWNTGAQFIKGYTSAEILGKNFRIFYTKEDRKAGLPEHLIDIATREGKVTHEGWRIRKDGTKFWGSVVITALHNAEGSIVGYSKVTRDLTERRQAEEAMKASAAELDLKNKTLERLNSELTSFSYIASHDLKEPLRKIQTFAARLDAEPGLNDKGKEYLSKIIQSATRMQKLIHDLLSYSEIANDESKFERVDLNAVLASVKNDLEVVIHEKKAVIKSKSLPVLFGIQHQFNQMVFNLVSNALKFSRPDVPPVINIDCKIIEGPDFPGMNPLGNNKYYFISFKDNGIGFEEEFASKIFQAFQRLHSKSEFSGTGIGLAIVKKVVENHNGVVEAQSTLGVGSTFNIYLPVDGSA